MFLRNFFSKSAIFAAFLLNAQLQAVLPEQILSKSEIAVVEDFFQTNEAHYCIVKSTKDATTGPKALTELVIVFKTNDVIFDTCNQFFETHKQLSRIYAFDRSCELILIVQRPSKK